jgi:site-specific recombinase XerD
MLPGAALPPRKADLMGDDVSLADLFESYAGYLAGGRKSPKTLTTYRAALRSFTTFLTDRGGEPVQSELTPQNVRAWLAALGAGKEPRSDRTISLYCIAIKGLSTYLWRDEITEKNLLARVEVPKAKRSGKQRPSDKDVKALLHACQPHTLTGIRGLAMVRLMADCGLRRAEVRDLLVADVNLTQRWIYVTGKGRKQRKLGMSDAVVRAMRQYWTTARPASHDPAFFVSQEGKQLSLQAVYETVKSLWPEAGCQIRPHDLRRYFGTKFQEEHKDLARTRDALGHANVRTTDLYLSPDQEDVVRKMQTGARR